MTNGAGNSPAQPVHTPVLSIVVYFILPAPFLNEALASIVSQLGPDTELIVVAGHAAGTDLEIDPQYMRYIDHLIVEPDPGAWDAANKGWRKARGRWIQFVMSDDELPGGSVEASLAQLRRLTCDIVTGGLTFFRCDRAGRRRLVSHHPGRTLSLKRVLGVLCSPAVLYRRELLERLGGFDGRFAYSHDRELLLRAWQAGARAGVLAHDVYAMRIHPASRTLSGDKSIMLVYLKEHLEFADDALRRGGILAEATRDLRRWRDEEAFKYFAVRAVLGTAGGVPLSSAERPPVLRMAAAAGRILTRKVLRPLRLKEQPPDASIRELGG